MFAHNRFVHDKVQRHKWKPINYRCHWNFNKVFGLAFFQSSVSLQTDFLFLFMSQLISSHVCIGTWPSTKTIRYKEREKKFKLYALIIGKKYIAKHNCDNSMSWWHCETVSREGPSWSWLWLLLYTPNFQTKPKVPCKRHSKASEKGHVFRFEGLYFLSWSNFKHLAIMKKFSLCRHIVSRTIRKQHGGVMLWNSVFQFSTFD